MPDLMSKVAQAKREAEEELKKQGSVDEPEKRGAAEEEEIPPVVVDDSGDDKKLKALLEGEAIPEAEPLKKEEIDEGYKHKFEVLQAKYNKEVPKLHAELKELRESNRTLSATLENTNALIKELKAEKPDPDTKAKKEQHKATKYSKLDPDDFNDYDDGIINIINTLNGVIEEADALKQENARLKGENESIKNDFTSVKDTATKTSESVAKSTTDAFWKAVKSQTPNFDKYNGEASGENADPRWVNFLSGYDENMTQYRVKAQKAIDDMNADDLVAVVKDFEKLIGENAENKRSGLEKQILPDSGSAATGGKSGKIRPVTEDDLDFAQKMMQQGKLSSGDFNKLLERYKQQQMQARGR